MKRILHLDMYAFFAVEEKRRPELNGNPVVIRGTGDPTQRGAMSTASYEARKFGVRSAMPQRTAYKLCPQAVFLPVDYGEYSRVSEKIKEILGEFSAAMEDVGIDEAFLDISQTDKPLKDIVSELEKRIQDETGLTCSIGIGPTSSLQRSLRTWRNLTDSPQSLKRRWIV